jgi:RNA polymerase sigma-70 factor (ECF subfamily)
MPIDLDEDRKLISAAKQNPAAFSFVFVRYYGAIFRFFALRAGDPREAEDLAMDVFVEALAALPRYRWQGRPLLAWLFAIARHRRVTSVRKRAVRARPMEEPPSTEKGWLDNGAGDACIEARRLLGRLDGPTAEALVLRFAMDCSFEEIAAFQGGSLSAAKMRVYRAVARARRAMGGGDEEGC